MTAEKVLHLTSSSSSSSPPSRHPAASSSTPSSSSKRPKHPDTSAGAGAGATSPARRQKPLAHAHAHGYAHSGNVTTPPKAAVATAAKRLGEMVGVGVGRGRVRDGGDRDEGMGVGMGRKTRSPRRVRREVAGVADERRGDEGERELELDLAAAKERIQELEMALRAARGEMALSQSLGLGMSGVGFEAGASRNAERPRSARSNMSIDSQSMSNHHVGDQDGDLNPRISPSLSQARSDGLFNDAQSQFQSQSHAHLQHHPPQDSYHHTPADWDALTARLHATEKQSQQRLAHLLSLKSTISSLTRPAVQATDSELAERLAQLGNRTREWVVRNFRRARLCGSAVDLTEETRAELAGVVPNFGYVETAERLQLLQAVVASVMVRVFEEEVVVGLPGEGEGALAALREVAALLRGAEGYRSWRHATIRSLQGSEAREELQTERERLVRGLAQIVLQHLHALTAVAVAVDAQAALEGIFADAADLQNVLLLQKAEYRVRFHRPRRGLGYDGGTVMMPMDFDAARMEAVNELDDDEEGVDADGDVVVMPRVVAFCVFPGLEKFGDEFGEHEEVRNVLVKARVCCERGD